MFKNLKLLFNFRSWLKSGTLQTGGIIATLGQIQVWLSSEDGVRLMDWAANLIGLTSSTFTGWVTTVFGLIFLWHRTNTERNLSDL